MGAGRVKTFLPLLEVQMRAQFMLSKGGKEKRDGLSHDEREAAELEQIAHDEQEDVKHLLALGGAAREEDDDERDDAEDGDGQVERVVVALPELLWGAGGVNNGSSRDARAGGRTLPNATRRMLTSAIIVVLTMISRM